MASANVLHLTDESFQKDVLESDQPVLVDFWAEWCGPCRMLAPTIDEIAEEYQGKARVGKVDTDTARTTALKYSISAIPTIILFHKGQVAKKFVGLTAKKEFKTALDALLAGTR